MGAPQSVTPYRTDPATHAVLSPGRVDPADPNSDMIEFLPTRGFIPFGDLISAKIKLAGDGSIVQVSDGTFKGGVLYPISIIGSNYAGLLLLY